MTREEAKELLPIIQAFAGGKTIQFLIGGKWTDIYETDFYQSSDKYRIKPELEYRPFKTQEECWNEMLKHQPFGWIKSPHGVLLSIGSVYEEGIAHRHSSLRFEEYLKNNYTFADGTPFGIKE